MERHFSLSMSLFVDMLLLHFAIASTILTATYAKTTPGAGFINIDCGSSRKSVFDNVTTLTWENDEKYTSNGRDAEIDTSSLESYFFSYPNLNALRTFRYFPGKHKRHCYVLPTPVKNISVLIRAMFYPGGFLQTPLTDKLKLPIDFDVAVNSTIWFSVRYDQLQQQAYYGYPLMFEGIFYSPGGPVNVCLIRKSGRPFISSLELRPLDEEGLMYSYEDSKKRYLVTKVRINFTNFTEDNVRFPDDSFDRLWDSWYTDSSLFGSHEQTLQNTTCVGSCGEGLSGSDTMLGAKFNNVPSRVMQDAIQFSPDSTLPSSTVEFSSQYSSKSGGGNLIVNSAYVVLYFQDLQSGSARSKALNINVNFSTYKEYNFSVSNNVTMQTFQDLILESTSVSIFLTTPMDPTALPFINAMEIYEEQFFNPSATISSDERGVQLLQQIFNLNDTGDPCFPVPYDWLQCDAYGYGRVTSVVLSEVDGHIGALNINNIGSFNSSDFPLLSGLDTLSVTHANVEDKLFEFIIVALAADENMLRPTQQIDFSHNNISSFPTQTALGTEASTLQFYFYLDTLNLSHNAFTGKIPSFLIDTYSSLSSLDLSYNYLSSFPASWKNATLLNFVVLNISNNIFSSNISSLDKLIQGNSNSLEHLDVSNNSLKGPFSSSIYFSNLDQLRVAKFDENQIDGTLNLTTWYKPLEEAEQLIKTNSTHFNVTDTLRQQPLFSFTNNRISNIVPNAEMIYSTLDFLSKSPRTSSLLEGSGILLGGNPYCTNTHSYAHRYLCRYSLGQILPGSKKISRDTITFSLVGGAAAFLMCCVLVTIILRLKKRVRGLQKIHQALANQKVIPLFYSLSEIKTATRKFHDDNLLGQGAFGVVYKGILADRSSLAVKKLYKSKTNEIQVFNDFINEVVLISGIRHKHLVHLKGCCVENQERILVYEYAEKGNVADALWGSQIHGILGWETRLKICVATAQGLQYLHEHLQPKIIHRDIKPANILLDKDFNPKIADFGLARSFPDDVSKAQTVHHGGTWGYLAPDHEITEKVDVYSYGIVVLEILSGRKVIESDGFPPEQRYLRTWAQKMYKEGTLMRLLQPDLQQHWSEMEFEVIRVVNVALLCVDLDPNNRPAMSQVVTMLVGSTDAPAPCTVDGFSSLDSDSLFNNDLSRSTPTFRTLENRLSHLSLSSNATADDDNSIVEERSLLGSQSGSNARHSINTIEMSDLSGR